MICRSPAVGSYSAGHKARKIETCLNDMAKDGWRLVALNAVTVLGFDIGFYLVVGREIRP
jgi:hypothetical protein